MDFHLPELIASTKEETYSTLTETRLRETVQLHDERVSEEPNKKDERERTNDDDESNYFKNMTW